MPTLVLIRHGQSAWNLENRFTGWWDVDLTDKGVAEAQAAGEMLDAKRVDIDLTLPSGQTRASRKLNIALEQQGRLWLPTESTDERSVGKECVSRGRLRWETDT